MSSSPILKWDTLIVPFPMLEDPTSPGLYARPALVMQVISPHKYICAYGTSKPIPNRKPVLQVSRPEHIHAAGLHMSTWFDLNRTAVILRPWVIKGAGRLDNDLINIVEKMVPDVQHAA